MVIRGKENTPVKEAQKQFSASKSVTSAVKVTDDILAKINSYALEDLTADDVFVGKQLLAHNGVDRDRERFPESMLDNFAETLPGKSVLYFHFNNYLPLGLYFDTETGSMSVEEFKQLTGEDPRLPDNVDQVKVMWAWYYVIKTDDMEAL